MNKAEFEQSVLELWMKTSIPLTRAHLQYHTGESARSVKSLVDELMVDGTLEPSTSDSGDLVWKVAGSPRAETGARTFEEFERMQRLSSEVRADFELKQAQTAKLEQEAKANRAAERQQQLALVKSRKSELAIASNTYDSDDTDDTKPRRRGLLARLFSKDSEFGDDFPTSQALDVASQLKRELDGDGKPVGKKEKSLLWSGGLSFFAGPVGWLYAGSLREAIPASLVYLAVAGIVSRLPSVLLGPIMAVVLPISGLVGLVYGWQYNRSGKRKRLFGDDKKKKKKPKELA